MNVMNWSILLAKVGVRDDDDDDDDDEDDGVENDDNICTSSSSLSCVRSCFIYEMTYVLLYTFILIFHIS